MSPLTTPPRLRIALDILSANRSLLDSLQGLPYRPPFLGGGTSLRGPVPPSIPGHKGCRRGWLPPSPPLHQAQGAVTGQSGDWAVPPPCAPPPPPIGALATGWGAREGPRHPPGRPRCRRDGPTGMPCGGGGACGEGAMGLNGHVEEVSK